MATMSTLRVLFSARRPKTPRRTRVLLVPERTDSGDRDRTGKLVCRDAAGELQGLDTRVFHRMVDTLQYGGEAGLVHHRWVGV